MQSILKRFSDWFSFDTRSLAIARIGLGLMVFADILTRMTDVEAHYTDFGILSRQSFISEFGFPWSFSLHLANGSGAFAWLMLGIHAFFALAMAFGWRTRLSTAMIAVLTISLQNRNWLINNGGDDVLRVIMVALAFIPWGEMWSMDYWRTGGGAEPRRVKGTWVLVLFVQVFCIYFVSYVLKDHPIWRKEFSALYYASHLDVFATDFSRMVRGYPVFMQVGSVFTIFLEWAGPLVIMLGWALPRKCWRWLRLAVVMAFWGLHGGIILTMNIGLFPYYCLAMWAVFLPSEFWNILLGRYPKIERHVRAFFACISGGPVLVQNDATRFWHYFRESLGLLAILTLIFWNLSTIKWIGIRVPFFINVARWTHVYQEWNMFAPFPKRENLWFEIPAVLEDGTTIELITGEKDVTSSKRKKFPGAIKNEHWRKLYLNLSDNVKLTRLYGGYMCRSWNRPVEEGGRLPRLRRLVIQEHHHVMLPDYVEGPLVKRDVWTHWCFSEDMPSQEPR